MGCVAKKKFTVTHNDREYQCLLDEDGRVNVLGENKDLLAMSSPTGITKVADAKDAAATLLESLLRKRPRKKTGRRPPPKARKSVTRKKKKAGK